MTINDKSVDGVLGTQTWGGRMVGADKSTEQWGHPQNGVSYWEDQVTEWMASVPTYLPTTRQNKMGRLFIFCEHKKYNFIAV